MTQAFETIFFFGARYFFSEEEMSSGLRPAKGRSTSAQKNR